MSSEPRRSRVFSALAIGLVLSLSVAGVADARRGGSFGSRGTRTYQSPAATMTAPTAVGPLQRTMTSPSQAAAGGYQPTYRPNPAIPGYGQPQGSFLNRWGGPLVGGLVGAGLMGMLMGHGFGGGYGHFGGFGGGLLALIIQIGLIALVGMFVMRLFRRGQGQGAYAPPFAGQPEPFNMGGMGNMGGPQPGMFNGPQAFGGQPGFQGPPPVNSKWAGDELGLNQGDFDAFERLLTDVQGAVGREDYAALREYATPEVMSFLTEELAQNAAAGRRNEVRDVHLISGDLSEAWSEASSDYATVAMRYSSIDLMRDRATGQIVEGDETPSQTTEIWTFVRERSSPWGGGVWKLSAIQDAKT